MAKALPRGIRNNNPGNLERGRDRWLGMSADQSSDARFVVFDTAEAGIRAIMRVLINYSERHGITTLRGAIERWAPAKENNSAAYVQHCARLTGYDPDEELDFLDEYTCVSLAKAIIRHENGSPEPYGRDEWYPEDVYQRAAVMAGFESAKKPLAKSRTVAGAAIAAVATVAGVAVAPDAPTSLPVSAEDVTTAVQVIGPLLGVKIMSVLSPVATLVGLGLTIYARWDDSRRKLR